MHVIRIPIWFSASIICSVALLAFWRGDWRARTIAASLVIQVAFEIYVCHTWACWGAGRPSLMTWRLVSEDAVLLLVCLACARRAERYWVLWASSFALLGFVTDLMRLVMPRITDWASAAAGVVWTYGLTATLLVGVWPAVRARLRPAR